MRWSVNARPVTLRDRPALVAGAAGAVAAAGLATLFGGHLGGSAWFLHLGRESPATVHSARQLFGPRVVVPHAIGHDGRMSWALARDPLLVHGRADRLLLDRPAYRAQRIAYPLIAAPWRVFGERALLWGLVATNVAIIAVGTAATARLSRLLGAPARAAVAFTLCPTVVVALLGDLGDALGVAGVVIAIGMVLERRWWQATAALVIACLARESSLLVVAAMVIATPRPTPWRARAMLGALPLIAVIAWGAYARWRLGWPPTGLAEFSVPGSGYLEAWRLEWSHLHNWGDAGAAAALWPLGALLALRCRRRPTVLRAAALAPALLVPLLSVQVVDVALNSLRALGASIALLGVDLYASASARPRAPGGTTERPELGRPVLAALARLGS